MGGAGCQSPPQKSRQIKRLSPRARSTSRGKPPMPMARGLERRGQSASTIANNYDISGGGMGRISVTMGGAHDLVQFSQVGRSPPAQSQPQSANRCQTLMTSGHSSKMVLTRALALSARIYETKSQRSHSVLPPCYTHPQGG